MALAPSVDLRGHVQVAAVGGMSHREVAQVGVLSAAGMSRQRKVSCACVSAWKMPRLWEGGVYAPLGPWSVVWLRWEGWE